MIRSNNKNNFLINQVNYEFNHKTINYQNHEHIKGKIYIEKSLFNHCQFYFNHLNIEDLDIILPNNHFINCTFEMQNCDLHAGKITFENSFFENCTMRFINTKIYNKYLDFHQITGLNEIIFIKSIFYCYTKFEESSINKIIFIKCMFENDIDLRILACDELVIEECKVSKILNLKFFKNTTIKSLNIYENINLGQILINWHEVKTLIKKNDKHYLIDDQNNLKLDIVSNNFYANQYLLLKENFRIQGKYTYEDLAYYEYRNHLEHKSLYSYVGRKIGKYGTHPIGILTFMLEVIFFFSLIYYLVENKTVSGNFLQNFSKYIYFSGITFFTIGYSDSLITTDLSKMIALVEAFFGVFIMAYFTGSFIRKVLR